MGLQLWCHVPGKGLVFLLNLFTAVALVFEGYNQGVLGNVSETPGFIAMTDISSNGNALSTSVGCEALKK